MNLFLRERQPAKKPLTDRLFGKEISNLCVRRPSANRSFVQNQQVIKGHADRSCVLSSKSHSSHKNNV